MIYAAFSPITAYIRGFDPYSHLQRDVCIVQILLERSLTSILHHSDSKLTSKGKLGKNTKVLQGTKGCRLKYKFWQQWTIISLLSISLYVFNVPRGSLYSFTRDNEWLNLCDIKAYGRPRVEWVGSMSRKNPKGFGLCTHPDVHGYRGQTRICMRLSG